LRLHASGPDGFAATSLHTLAQMVASGLGVTLLPRLGLAAASPRAPNSRSARWPARERGGR
jgi:DNA-binding transcriptional LysR family regulator